MGPEFLIHYEIFFFFYIGMLRQFKLDIIILIFGFKSTMIFCFHFLSFFYSLPFYFLSYIELLEYFTLFHFALFVEFYYFSLLVVDLRITVDIPNIFIVHVKVIFYHFKWNIESLPPFRCFIFSSLCCGCNTYYIYIYWKIPSDC